jgi:hypothetical protein
MDVETQKEPGSERQMSPGLSRLHLILQPALSDWPPRGTGQGDVSALTWR